MRKPPPKKPNPAKPINCKQCSGKQGRFQQRRTRVNGIVHVYKCIDCGFNNVIWVRGGVKPKTRKAAQKERHSAPALYHHDVHWPGASHHAGPLTKAFLERLVYLQRVML